LSVTEWDTGWTAVPNRETVIVGLMASLATLTVPFRVPAAEGAKVTFKVAELPAPKIRPEETPPVLNPAPESVTFNIEMLVPPAFVSTTAKVLLLPTIMFPNFKAVALAVSCPAVLTLSIAMLLMIEPPALFTDTVNCDPLSADVVTGIV